MNRIVGILRILYLVAASSLLSTSTLPITTLSLSLYSFETSSIIGPTTLHGPHHSAQKSITTNLSVCNTSSKFASVICNVIYYLCYI